MLHLHTVPMCGFASRQAGLAPPCWHDCNADLMLHMPRRDGQLSLEESWRLPSPEDVVQSAETGTEALSRAEEEQNLAEQPMDELEAMMVRCSDIPLVLFLFPIVSDFAK